MKLTDIKSISWSVTGSPMLDGKADGCSQWLISVMSLPKEKPTTRRLVNRLSGFHLFCVLVHDLRLLAVVVGKAGLNILIPFTVAFSFSDLCATPNPAFQFLFTWAFV